ncbi:MAG TPA: hypothetical protein VKY42_10470, partial [Trueperaceae bacterium]|nr:hypothetical protein [Trueperaceae bacterium]
EYQEARAAAWRAARAAAAEEAERALVAAQRQYQASRVAAWNRALGAAAAACGPVPADAVTILASRSP